MLTDTSPIYPVPEAIERPDIEGAFEIEGGFAGSTDLVKAKMVVPLGGVCIECGVDHAYAIRSAELGHTAFTPKDWEQRVKRTKDKLPVSLVAACEDARIVARRKKAGLPDLPSRYCAKDEEHYFMVRQAARTGDFLSLAQMLVASYGTGDEEPMKEAMIRLVKELGEKADPVEKAKALVLADLWGSLYHNTRYQLTYRKATFRYSLALARDVLHILEGTATAMEKALEDEKAKKGVKTTTHTGKGKHKKPMPSDVKFGKMTVVRLPLPNRSKAGYERRWTARDEGPIPTRFDRWSIDRRIFRTKKRGKGAAVLIDASGSMRWTQEHLAQVLDEVPAATIAIYSGRGTEGKLVIVASKGRCASMRQAATYMMGGNIIDGPALEWLADQPENVKIWMSDGGITGLNDGWCGEGGNAYCERFIRKGGIQQVRRAEDVIAILSGKRPFVPSKGVNQSGWM